MKKFFLHIIFYSLVIFNFTLTKAENSNLELNKDDIVNIKADIHNISDADSLSGDTKKILDDIYFRKKVKNYLRKDQNIEIDKLNVSSEAEYYDTITGNPNLNIEVKKPNETLLEKQQKYFNAYNTMKQGYYEAAIILFEKLLVEYPEDKFILSSLAASYQKLGEDKLAYKYYEKSLILYPDDYLILNNFLLLVTKESPNAALQEFLKLDKIYLKNDFLKAQIAYLYAKNKNYELALNYIQAAINLNQSNVHYHYYKAVIFDQMNLKNEALPLYLTIFNTGSYKEIGISKNLLKNRINELSS